jgi:Rrf2 family protein
LLKILPLPKPVVNREMGIARNRFGRGLHGNLRRLTLNKTNTVGLLSFTAVFADIGLVQAAWRQRMLRLTKKADYGLMALKYLAEQADAGARSAKDIAEAYHIPPPLLAKILQTLAKAGLLVSHAGTYGGYALARSATEISAFEVIRAIDGPLFITSCITIHGTCDLAGHCTIKEPLRKVNDSIKDLLSAIRISDLAEAGEGQQGVAVGGGLVSILV